MEPNADAVAEELAANLRAEIARRKISQAVIGEVLNVSQNGVSRRITGKTPWSVAELVKVSAYLGAAPVDLLPLLGQQPGQHGRSAA